MRDAIFKQIIEEARMAAMQPKRRGRPRKQPVQDLMDPEIVNVVPQCEFKPTCQCIPRCKRGNCSREPWPKM